MPAYIVSWKYIEYQRRFDIQVTPIYYVFPVPGQHHEEVMYDFAVHRKVETEKKFEKRRRRKKRYRKERNVNIQRNIQDKYRFFVLFYSFMFFFSIFIM